MFMYSMYEDLLKELYPDKNEKDVAAEVDKNFATWFENYVRGKLVFFF